ncbi:MAG: tetratricopeptide repeat protein [Limnothrix sp.]
MTTPEAMTPRIIEKYYQPRPWVCGLSGAFLVMALGLLLMPSVDRRIMARRAAVITQAELEADPAIALLEKEAQSYEVWLEKEPTNEKALRGLLEVRLEQNDIARAAIPLETLARIRGNNPDYLILLGQVKQKAKDYEGSAAAFKKILLTDPGNTKALQGMVDLMLEQNRPEGAISLLQEALKEMGKPKEDQTIEIDAEKVTSIQLMLGQVYVDQERTTEAIAIYDQAAAINKTDFRPVLAKAMVLKNLGKDAEAKSFFTTAITLAPAKYKDQIKDMALFDEVELKTLEALEAPEAEATPETPEAEAAE